MRKYNGVYMGFVFSFCSLPLSIPILIFHFWGARIWCVCKLYYTFRLAMCQFRECNINEVKIVWLCAAESLSEHNCCARASQKGMTLCRQTHIEEWEGAKLQRKKHINETAAAHTHTHASNNYNRMRARDRVWNSMEMCTVLLMYVIFCSECLFFPFIHIK